MRKDLKIIWGSDTGNTEGIVNTLKNECKYYTDSCEVSDMTPEKWKTHDIYMLAIPTWYDGDLQSDWEDYFEDFKKIDFTDKFVCIIGLGDQDGYPEYFVDGIGILAKVVIKNGGVVFGHWSTEGYDYEKSKAEIDKNTFYGLAIDEDSQYHLTDERINKWLTQITKEIDGILRNHPTKDYCHYSDLPSPSAYTENTNYNKK